MKRIFLLMLSSIFYSTVIFAQNVGIGTTTPNSSAQLDVTSTSKGLLLPRMTTAAINSIINPAKGLLAMDTLLNQLMVNTGKPSSPNWQTIAFNSAWNLIGNSNTSPATQFIGTTDLKPLLFRVNNHPAGIIHPANDNTAFGLYSLYSNTTGTGNTANGNSALFLNTAGHDNTASGFVALQTNTTGNYNTANGSSALYANTTGAYNTANGYSALTINSTGTFNTAMGATALYNNTTGGLNTATGYEALYSNTTGGYNTANGVDALYSNTTGSWNTANGYRALYNNNRDYNTANGYAALFSNTTGIDNTANGYETLFFNTTGVVNTAAGVAALHDNTTGNYNTANGADALYANTTGNYNTATGEQSLFVNTTGYGNTANGYEALSNNNGLYNTATGYEALYNNGTGVYNTAIGYEADNDENYLNGNTLIGSYTYIKNASFCTAIGYGASTMNTDNLIVLGSPPIAFTGGYTPWTNFSDGRFKKNINEEVKGLDFIMRLRPVTYHMDVRGLYNFWGISPYGNGKEKADEKTIAFIDKSINKKEAITMTGFVAQEVEKAAKESDYNFDGVIPPQSDKDHYRIAYEEFVVPLVKAMQEQQTIIETQNKKLDQQQKQIDDLVKELQLIKEKIN